MVPARSTCEDVQVALVERGEQESWILEHAAACPECRFFKELSRELSGSGALPEPPTDSGLGPFEALLAHVQATGTLLLRYRLQELLGGGGQGVVYRAVDTETGEAVALKLVRCPQPHAGTTASEVTHAHLVRHLGICRVYHTERHGDLRLIVMELIDGERLDEAVAQSPLRHKLAVFKRVCEAVAAAHEAGVLHLDLKPSNVLVRRSGEPVVTDFGLSMRLSGEQPVRSRGGTLRYMAPEQRDDRPVDQRTDVFALGMILGELLQGASGGVKRIIERATAESPERRYPDVRSLVRALDRPERLRRWGRLAAGLAPFAVLGVGLLSFRGPTLPGSDVLVVGGHGTDGQWTPSAEIFDGRSWRWRTIEPVPEPGRSQPRTCELRAVRSGDQVLVLGGGGAAGCAVGTTNQVRVYSLATRNWSLPECQTPCIEYEGSTFTLDRTEKMWQRRWKKAACRPDGPCMLYGRNTFVALSLPNDDVFVYGGCAGACSGPNELDQTEYPMTRGWPVSLARTAETYRRATRTWTPLLPSLRPRPQPVAAYVGGEVLVCGRGSLFDNTEADGTCELFDRNATKDAWGPAGRMPGGASDVVMVSVGTHAVLGLQPGHAWLWGDKSMWGHSPVWRWDGSCFEPLPLPARGHHGGTLTRLRDGRVLLAGGVESDRVVSTAQVFTLEPEGKGGVWKEVSRMRQARRHHAAVPLQDGRILVAGGCGPEPLSSAEVYDPVQDRWIEAGRMSTVRCRPEAVAIW